MKSRTHLARVAELPCCVTGRHPVEVHHVKTGLSGAGQKCSDMFTIPLAPEIHSEFHSQGRTTWEMKYGRQADHLADTLSRLMYS